MFCSLRCCLGTTPRHEISSITIGKQGPHDSLSSANGLAPPHDIIPCTTIDIKPQSSSQSSRPPTPSHPISPDDFHIASTLDTQPPSTPSQPTTPLPQQSPTDPPLDTLPVTPLPDPFFTTQAPDNPNTSAHPLADLQLPQLHPAPLASLMFTPSALPQLRLASAPHLTPFPFPSHLPFLDPTQITLPSLPGLPPLSPAPSSGPQHPTEWELPFRPAPIRTTRSQPPVSMPISRSTNRLNNQTITTANSITATTSDADMSGVPGVDYPLPSTDINPFSSGQVCLDRDQSTDSLGGGSLLGSENSSRGAPSPGEQRHGRQSLEVAQQAEPPRVTPASPLVGGDLSPHAEGDMMAVATLLKHASMPIVRSRLSRASGSEDPRGEGEGAVVERLSPGAGSRVSWTLGSAGQSEVLPSPSPKRLWAARTGQGLLGVSGVIREEAGHYHSSAGQEQSEIGISAVAAHGAVLETDGGVANSGSGPTEHVDGGEDDTSSVWGSQCQPGSPAWIETPSGGRGGDMTFVPSEPIGDVNQAPSALA